MALLIGMDEAGYGPNLGPLVISTSVWRVPDDFAGFESALAGIVSASGPSADQIHVADSKRVYTPARGLRELERAMQVLFDLGGIDASAFRSLCSVLTGHPADVLFESEPWFVDSDLALPVASAGDGREALAARLRLRCEEQGIELLAIRSDVVLTRRFNEISDRFNSKGAALSRLSLALLRSVWDPDTDEPVMIIGDKHGGRSRYDDLIDEQLNGQMIFRLCEGRQKSSYRVGCTELHFQTGAEEHLPVAVASMTCKYIRELAMKLFNAYWQRHVDGLKPTAGYPQDARRFRADIDQAATALQIDEDVLWRRR